MDTEVVKAKFNPVQLALLDTAASPRGTFKQAWTMTLLRRGHRCQLPRGFVKSQKPAFVGGR